MTPEEARQQSYVSSEGSLCPFCFADAIRYTGPLESGAGVEWSREVMCTRCQKRWHELIRFEVDGFEEIPDETIER